MRLFTKTAFRIAGSAVTIFILVKLAYYSFLLAKAGWYARLNSKEGYGRAAQLAPGNAAYHLELARIESETSDPDHSSVQQLRRALELNPRSSAAWIEAGLHAEIAGNYREAEQALLSAAQVDRQHEPRWTLANYYFRRNDPEKFWTWARSAAEMAYDDLTPLFRLCWNISDNPATILSRVIPNQVKAQRQYLAFLLNGNRMAAAESAAERLARSAGMQDLDELLAYCDRLLANPERMPRSPQAALTVWNTLAARRVLPYPPLSPQRGVSLTNGDFSHSPLSHGFDWRLIEFTGVAIALNQAPPELVITFSGKQPETLETVYQFVPVMAVAKYELRFRYRTRNIAPGSGLACRVVNASLAAAPAIESLPLSSEDWKPAVLSFKVPEKSSLVKLAIAYQRALGTTRIEGSVSLVDFRLHQSP